MIGIAGTLPGAADLAGLWPRLVAAQDLVGPAPADRLELHADPRTATVRGGFVADVGRFDAALFRVSPAEARLMDPQQRLFLETVWRVVEDAGYRPDALAGSDTGLFVGVSTTDYADLLRLHDIPVQAHTASGIAHSILANRVSHILDLRGPSEAVDTACSSSLVALHRAVRALAAGDCSLAVAGGVNVLLSPGLFTAFQQSGMLSPQGACRTFDRRADGYVRGEGAGAVLLKPLAAAQADGDHVYAVIRGTAVNHGGRSASLTAPNPQAQADVLVRAYREAGVDPREVGAIELHGTGTALGDPVEAEGLKKAFRVLYEDHGLPAPGAPHVALGSVKTNIGHLEAAAGMAGLLKMLLALRHEVLPPSIHFAEPNPHLRLDGTPLFVNDRARPWSGPRVAGVSSFGFGGTNAHVVLASQPRPAAAPPRPQLLVISARGAQDLRRYAAALADALTEEPAPDLARVAYTLQVGRTPWPYRAALVAGSVAEAVEGLRAIADGTSPGPYGRARPVPEPAAPVGGAQLPAGLSLTGLADRWVAGEHVPWDRLWEDGRAPGRTPLPGAPLGGDVHWFDDRAATAAPARAGAVRPTESRSRKGPDVTVQTPGQDQEPQTPPTRRRVKITLAPVPGGAAMPPSRTEPGPVSPRTAVAAPPVPRPPGADHDRTPAVPAPPPPADPSRPRSVPPAAPSPVDPSRTRSVPPAAPSPVDPSRPRSVPPAAPSPVDPSRVASVPPDAPSPAGPDGAASVPHDALPPAGPERTPAAERVSVDEMSARIGTEAADILGLAEEDVAEDRPFAELGLDSIFRMDLARRLNEAFGTELQAAELYEYDTAGLLARYIATLPPTPPPAPTPTPTVPIATPAPQVPSADPDQAVPTAPVAQLGSSTLSGPATPSAPPAPPADAVARSGAVPAAHAVPRPDAVPAADAPRPAAVPPADAVPRRDAVPRPGDQLTRPDDLSARPDAVPPPGDPLTRSGDLLGRLVERIAGRVLDRARDFTGNGLTSFDMLRTVSALERRFGALPKTLLFDHPTVPALASHLTGSFGAARAARLLGEALAADEAGAAEAPVVLRAVGPGAAAVPADGPGRPGGPLVVRKRGVDALPEAAGAIARIDAAHAKEGGLAGRDIAPLAFIGSTRRAYFNFSRSGEHLFAWSYAGPEQEFATLAAEWVDYADRYGMRPSFLSLIPLTEAGGVPLTATAFGAVQRLEDLSSFTLSGGGMSRLRNLVARFERSGRVRLDEYEVGSDPATDREITDMIDRWGGQKQMVNPYVAVVKRELAEGRLPERHRMFLTRINGELANAVIVTKIPSEPGYLLDLEFYPAGSHRGGMEYAIVGIIGRLRDEGHALFSFGASFGVKLADTPNASPQVEQGLAELRSVGVFGEGNFRFKNKFRPANRPIFLCQRADGPVTPVSEVILMIADPDIGATAPELVDPARTPGTGPGTRPGPGTRTGPGTAVATPPGALPKTPAPPTAHPDEAARLAALARSGYNPLALLPGDVDFDLLTDSWAEFDDPAVRRRTAALRDRIEREQDPADFTRPGWLPFDCALPTPSGRAAEALLCRNWPGPRGTVIHNGLFLTWLLALADEGFTALRTDTVVDGGAFPGDLDPRALREHLTATGSGACFVAVELSGNATGGRPVSLAGLRAVRAEADAHGVPLVLDATRIVDNAAFIAAHEPEWRGADLWKVVEELLAQASAATFSLSKDFAVTGGGLLASRLPQLSARLAERLALRGAEVGLPDRRLFARALAERDEVAGLVRERMAAVRELGDRLRDAGLPVVEPVGAHCVLLDVGRMPAFADLAHPVESCLAWMYQGTGVRAAAHLAAPRQIRLAVPVGLGTGRAAAAGERLARLWRSGTPVPDLLPVDGTGGGPGPRCFHPAGALPEDIGQAMREGHRARDDNAAVLAEHAPHVARSLVELPDGTAEVFTAGSGPALLMMTPFNIGAGVFARQFAGLADRHRLITVHHPGVGATTVARDLTLDGIADLYRAVLDALGVTGPVHVLGSSFGGLVAQSFALRHPGRTASLTLVGSSYKVGNRNGEVNRLSVVAAEDFGRIEAHGGRLRDGRAALEELLLRCESMDPKLGLSYLDVFSAQPTLFARLPEISVPTLILWGRHDTVIPVKATHLLHGAIPTSRLVQLDDAGHFPCLTHADEVHRELLPFLAAHEPSGGER
ncbi:alpha/beta fold hydrolase [Streptomyces sp. SID486]|uniref:alpha/beta fold hydrolase n=1 Tax=Streptomyces sp. SID486 TaxID=2690264 RepID=UPI0031F71D15